MRFHVNLSHVALLAVIAQLPGPLLPIRTIIGTPRINFPGPLSVPAPRAQLIPRPMQTKALALPLPILGAKQALAEEPGNGIGSSSKANALDVLFDGKAPQMPVVKPVAKPQPRVVIQEDRGPRVTLPEDDLLKEIGVSR